MIFERKLAIPMRVKERLPLTAAETAQIEARRAEIRAIFDGADDRLLLVVGPCSADREDSVLEYCARLRALQEKVADRLLLVPRVFTNKPRTTGDGYKGLVHQPDPTEKPDLFHGVIATRKLHLRVIRETGFVSADEMLYPENYKYIDDLLGYVTVGARSVEDQQHRLTASGLEVPVGMKNPTGGDLTAMVNAVYTARRPHSFIYRGWAAHSQGNPYAHCILRGRRDLTGADCANYDTDTLRRTLALCRAQGLDRPAVLVDANHANSGKDPFRQPDVVRAVLAARQADGDLRGFVKGFLIESYLEDGAQPVSGGVFGKSITDPCLGWAKTERLLLALAEKTP